MEFKVVEQSCKPIVKIYSFANKYQQADVLDTSSNLHAHNKIQGYSFTETVAGFGGSFTMQIYEDTDTYNKRADSAWQRISVLDLVEIYEQSSKVGTTNIKPTFSGVVHKKSFKSSISGSQVNRTLTISGTSVQSLIDNYTVSLDVHTLTNVDAALKDLKMKVETVKNDTKKLGEFIKALWESFVDLEQSAISSTTQLSKSEIAEVIAKKYLGGDIKAIDKITVIDDVNLLYPIMVNYFNQSVNKFTDMIRQILPVNYYELFCRQENGEPKVVIRQAPFNPEDWMNLKPYEIRPEYLKGYVLDQSDNEVYTAFFAFVEGLGLEESQKKTFSAIEQSFVSDKEKMKKYGYKLLECSFNGFDISKKGTADFSELNLEDISQSLCDWYKDIDVMLSGSINLITDVEDTSKNPRAGDKVKFMGMEFYVTDTEHSWSYGGVPLTNIAVTRGGYYQEGKFVYIEDNAKSSGMFSKIPDVTKRYTEFRGN